jgi:hypothetical protein
VVSFSRLSATPQSAADAAKGFSVQTNGFASRPHQDQGLKLVETIDEVLTDLGQLVNDSIASEAFASMGLRQLQTFFSNSPRTAENPDPQVFIGVGDPNQAESRQYASWRISEALEQIAPNGPVETQLGQQWLVSLYAAWEHEYRRRLAKAHGVSEGMVIVPVFGDLRLLRHDILHCHGIATAENAGRCVVLQHWFVIGQPIQIGGEHHLDFVTKIPWDKMRQGPDSS